MMLVLDFGLKDMEKGQNIVFVIKVCMKFIFCL
jgi:hypothetical protein